MNLLTDRWIPVRDESGFRQIRFQDLLCEEHDWQVSLPRDDMELACLQLLICLTQVMFMPPDVKALRARIRTPLALSEFEAGAKAYRDWFDLDHPETPFMQTRGVKGEWTSMQKLFPGLPEKTSKSATAHCFFNEVSELRNVSAACCAIALFNQASNTPSFGGGFKGSLRRDAPITTLIVADSSQIPGDRARQRIWYNILSLDNTRKIFPTYERQLKEDKPTWVKLIQQSERIQASQIGLLRGLFWQPAKIELVRTDADTICDFLGGSPQQVYTGFYKEKFTFKVNGVWPHPHGARTLSVRDGEQKETFLSFKTTAPAWTQLNEFLIRHEQEGKEGQIPAAVVSQFPEVFPDKPLHLIVGGYRNNKASILQRRHELFSIAQGWDKNVQRVRELIEIALRVKDLLFKYLRAAARGNKKKRLKGLGVDIHKTAVDRYYKITESLLHETLRSLNFREFTERRARFARRLSEISLEIFEQVTKPYTHKPELIPIIAISRRRLQEDLNKMEKGATQHG